MTPRQRMNLAMQCLPADRVPLMCQFSIGHMLLQLGVSPSGFWFDQDTFTEGLVRLREIYDFDGILISLHGHDPSWREKVRGISRDGNVEMVEWMNGDKTICPFDELPYYKYNSEQPRIDLSDFDPTALPPVLDYIPVSQNLHFTVHPGNRFGSIESIVKRCGEEYSIHGEITSPFDYFLDITGHQDGLTGLMLEPEACRAILLHFTKKIKALALDMCATGIDAIKLSSPFAGSGFISKEMYREFVLPYEREIAQVVRDKGVHIYTHTCGCINDRLEIMFESGISGIECLDPPPIGDVELSDAFKRIGDKGFIKGNIDSVNLLLKGSREDIIAEISKMLKTAEGFPGYILSTACSIAPRVKRENIQLLREIVADEL